MAPATSSEPAESSSPATPSGLGNGRRAEAARNDRRILESARAVFIANPSAPIAAVAKHARVGIGALYRRYPSKQDLLRALCAEGLDRYITAAEAALRTKDDPWQSFAAFMRAAVEADASSLTQRLAGTFAPTPELSQAAAHAGQLNVKLFDRTQAAGAIRGDADVNDIAMILEQLASIGLGDAERTRQLRRRYLALALDGLRTRSAPPLPKPPPTDQELTKRWEPPASH